MALVMGLALALWMVGYSLGAPIRARLMMIGLLYVGVLLIHVAMPEGSSLRQSVGGSLGEWLVLGGSVGIVWAYSKGLNAVKDRARLNAPPDKSSKETSVAELERNARHIVLREIGGTGQKRLKDARVLIVGAGGLGSPALLYLGAAGVGTIGVVDDDVVENSNLQRQIIHTDDRIGIPKVFSAQKALLAQNPFVTIRPYHRRMTEEIAEELIADYDLVLDGTDDPDTRYLVNRIAVKFGVPLVSAAISQWEGQVSIFDPSRGTPCYHCVFPERAAAGLAPSCADGGVLGPLPGVLGAMMAVEAIKILAGAGEPLLGRLMIYDALYSDMRVVSLKRNPKCPVCGAVT